MVKGAAIIVNNKPNNRGSDQLTSNRDRRWWVAVDAVVKPETKVQVGLTMQSMNKQVAILVWKKKTLVCRVSCKLFIFVVDCRVACWNTPCFIGSTCWAPLRLVWIHSSLILKLHQFNTWRTASNDFASLDAYIMIYSCFKQRLFLVVKGLLSYPFWGFDIPSQCVSFYLLSTDINWSDSPGALIQSFLESFLITSMS